MIVRDGFCNDETNNPGCNYDGGDCCGSCVVTEQCLECQCLGGVDGVELSSPSIGDGYCQDGNNNGACNYDGGDCCGSCVNTDHCAECTCLAGDSGNGIYQCATSGVITSPGYPQNYDSNLDLSWLIVVPIGQTIEINFISFQTENT